jgi:hypothetical protein
MATSVHAVEALERQEAERIVHAMARERGLTFRQQMPAIISRVRPAGIASSVSGRFAIIENGFGPSSFLGS